MTGQVEGQIARHRTAIGRARLSKPLRLALEAGLASDGGAIMDYGCGRGDDVRRLRRMGYDVAAWDPAYRPEGAQRPSELVNLGYVLNVIEAPSERATTLQAAWELAEEALVVSAMVTVDSRTKAIPFGDGVLTSRGTFQKYYDQQELELFIRSTLQVEPVALGLGVFAVARSPARRARLAALRFRHRPRALCPETAAAVFEDNQAVLQPLVDFVEERGRLPRGKEHGQFPDVAERFGSVQRATRLLQRAIPSDFWAKAVEAARSDLLLFLALTRFGERPRFSEFDDAMQSDIRGHFGSYNKALGEADALLFSLGQPGTLKAAAAKAAVGKKLPDSLYVHVEALNELPLVLRLYEGCARRYLGGVEGADLVKLRVDRPSISYLTYPDFWRTPHPTLARSLQVHLQTFRVKVNDYSERENPPVLHRKELFIGQKHAKHATFARLTRQEERRGLLDSPTRIGTQKGWQRVLAEHGVRLRGHRLVKAPVSEGGRASESHST